MQIFITAVSTIALVACASSVASAREVRYRYDSLGRLVQADQSAPSQPNSIRLTYDRVGNRLTQVVDGSPNGSATAVIVAPLGSSFAVIPIERQQ